MTSNDEMKTDAGAGGGTSSAGSSNGLVTDAAGVTRRRVNGRRSRRPRQRIISACGWSDGSIKYFVQYRDTLETGFVSAEEIDFDSLVEYLSSLTISSS